MSDTANNVGGFTSTSEVGLIVGIVIISVVLITVLIIVIVLVCRCRIFLVHRRKKKRGLARSRSRNPMISDGDNNNSPANHGSYGQASATNRISGEFRPNPLAEEPFNRPYIPNQGVSILTLPDGGFGYPGQRLANSMQALNTPNSGIDNMAFHASLYEKLTDTIHQERGRPLYVCKRADYAPLANHFDIVGQTRGSDWLVRPRSTIPNRPIKKRNSSKKNKAPQPQDSKNSRHSRNSYGSDQKKHSSERKKNSAEKRFRYASTDGIGGVGRPTSAVIATPFGAAQRGHYLSGSNLNINMENTIPNYEQRYTSLPRDGKLQRNSDDYNSRGAAKLHRNISERIPKTPMDEALYTHVVKKNAINQPRKPESQVESSDTIFYSRAVTLPPRMNGKPQVYTIEESPKPVRSSNKTPVKDQLSPQPRERSGSTSTQKSLGITEQFKFLDDFDKF